MGDPPAGRAWWTQLTALTDSAADLLLPRPCPGCGRPEPWCATCAATVGPPRRVRLPDQLVDAAAMPAVWALARYRGPVRAAILAGKEKGRRDLPERLGPSLGRAVLQLHGWGAVPQPVWLVPAPSRRSAARRRGGDPVRTMAAAAARTAAVAGLATGVAPCLVTDGRARDSVGLDAAARHRNLDGRVRMLARAAPAPGGTVLLVDDVLTTGATAIAAARAVRASGLRVAGMLVLATVPPWVRAR